MTHPAPMCVNPLHGDRPALFRATLVPCEGAVSPGAATRDVCANCLDRLQSLALVTAVESIDPASPPPDLRQLEIPDPR